MQNIRQRLRNCSKIVFCASASAALLWCANPAKAVLNINIYDDGPNLTVVASGSLSALGTILNDLDEYWGRTADPGSLWTANCLPGMLLHYVLCTGPVDILNLNGPLLTNLYYVTGQSPGPLPMRGAGLVWANSVSGDPFILNLAHQYYGTDVSYEPGMPFFSSATFNNTSLADQGFTTTGLVGTWTINGTSESINLFVVPPPTPPSEVPGPLPLFGAAAAYGWSRRIRRRITAPVRTPPQA